MGSLYSGILFEFEDSKLNVCTTKSVEMAYYFDHLPNLKPLNVQFRQEIKIFLYETAGQNLDHGLKKLNSWVVSLWRSPLTFV